MEDVSQIRIDPTQYKLLRRCSKANSFKEWDEWRKEHPEMPIKLVGADFESASLEQINLKGADLRGANLQRADLNGANLRQANLNGALFFQAMLQKADLRGAYLWGADLSGVNLEGAKFIGANLTRTNLKGAKLDGVHFESKDTLAHLAHPLTEVQMASAVFSNEQLQVLKNNPVQHKDAPQPVEVPQIARSIVFDRENFLAGIGILTYFGEIIRQKLEDIKATVVVEYEELNARLSVIADPKEQLLIEETLEEYICAVTGRKQKAGFLPDPLGDLALKQKLDRVYLELRQTQALMAVENVCIETPANLEASIDRLNTILWDSICIKTKKSA